MSSRQQSNYTLYLFIGFIACMILNHFYDPMIINVRPNQWFKPEEVFAAPLVKLLMYGVNDQFQTMASFSYMSEYFAGEYSHYEEVTMYLDGLILLLSAIFIHLSQRLVVMTSERLSGGNEKWVVKTAKVFMLNSILGYIASVLFMFVLRFTVAISPLQYMHEGANGLLLAAVFAISMLGILSLYSMTTIVICYICLISVPFDLLRWLAVAGINEQICSVIAMILSISSIFFIWCGFLQEKVERLTTKLIRFPLKVLYALMVKIPFKIIEMIFGL